MSSSPVRPPRRAHQQNGGSWPPFSLVLFAVRQPGQRSRICASSFSFSRFFIVSSRKTCSPFSLMREMTWSDSYRRTRPRASTQACSCSAVSARVRSAFFCASARCACSLLQFEILGAELLYRIRIGGERRAVHDLGFDIAGGRLVGIADAAVGVGPLVEDRGCRGRGQSHAKRQHRQRDRGAKSALSRKIVSGPGHRRTGRTVAAGPFMTMAR